MAHEKEKEIPLLMEQLSVPEKVMLGQTMHTPGFKIVIKLLDELCRRFDEAVKLLDPEEADYVHKLAARAPRARDASEFRNLLLNSIKHHADSAHQQAVREDVEAIDAVSKTFGIHIVPKKTKIPDVGA
jgi:hypothetical protein